MIQQHTYTENLRPHTAFEQFGTAIVSWAPVAAGRNTHVGLPLRQDTVGTYTGRKQKSASDKTHRKITAALPVNPVIPLMNDAEAARFIAKNSLKDALGWMYVHAMKVFELSNVPALYFNRPEQQIFLAFAAPGNPEQNLIRYESFYTDLLDSVHSAAIRHVGIHYASTELET